MIMLMIVGYTVKVNQTDSQRLLENAEKFGTLVGNHIRQAAGTSEIVVMNDNIGKN